MVFLLLVLSHCTVCCPAAGAGCVLAVSPSGRGRGVGQDPGFSGRSSARESGRVGGEVNSQSSSDKEMS